LAAAWQPSKPASQWGLDHHANPATQPLEQIP